MARLVSYCPMSLIAWRLSSIAMSPDFDVVIAPAHRAVRVMDDQEKLADIETLARMAARLAGRDPDEHVKLAWGKILAFEGPVWRYPDFLQRAEQAYALLG
jgi:hypothetical protein